MSKKLSLAEIRRTIDFAKRSYGSIPGIVGFGIGTKYKDTEPTKENFSLQFYVKKKKLEKNLKDNVLPKYVLARKQDGRADRKKRIPTDVIQVGKIRPCCVAGDVIRSLNGRGALTLLFHNKDSADAGSRYVLTCSHVAGDMRSSPPLPKWIRSNCATSNGNFAETLKSSVAKNGSIDFDIAISTLNSSVNRQPDCGVPRPQGDTLSRWMTRSQISLPLKVDCALPVSKIKEARVTSFLSSVLVSYPIGDVEVKNALLLDASVVAGDSGGLLYLGNAAVGIVFARSDEGLCWFHLVSEAVNFINNGLKPKVKIFS